MVNNHYRWDFIGLSTDEKPTPQTSEKVVDGSTFYTSDDSKLYVWCKDQWYEKTVEGGGGGGTSNFNQLTNRPKYNGTEMTGDTDIPEVVNSAFTGTDGTAAGTTGLVPAPATTDAGKFLNANGTWTSAGGDAFTELTSADYNYPADNPDGVAVWLLPLGLYKLASGTKCYFTSVYTYTGDEYNPRYFGVMADRVGSIVGRKSILMFAIHYSSGSHVRDTLGCYTVINGASSDYEARLLLKQSDIANNLTTTSIGYALDATQGKILDDKITALAARVSALEDN